MSRFIPLITSIAQGLQSKNWQLVTAESCTGGLIASCLTEMPGSSKWFERGFVTYSNLSKEEMLGVSSAVLLEFGAVSEPVAAAMAMGALQHSAANLAVSVTGIAGPSGGSIEKPVGTVCLGFAIRGEKARTLTIRCSGDRQAIRLEATQRVLEGILKLL